MPHPIELRDVKKSDLPVFFEQQRDPAANQMAAFTSRDPEDVEAFEAHWSRMHDDDTIVVRTILFDGEVAGHVASFELHGKPQVTYWIGKDYWGRGVATAALSEFLNEFTARPLYASAAVDNVASIRVLEKCGFAVSGHEKAFAGARNEEIEERMFELR